MFEELVAKGWTRQTALWMAVIFVLCALILRGSTFGNPDLAVDEQFYLLVGQRLHQGALLYVDVWDRKPIGLFLLYGLFASLPDPVVAYQIAASLFAVATAWVISRILATCLIGPAARQRAILGGLAYLLLLGPFDGFGGQAPVFYNLFIAVAAALVLQHDVVLPKDPAPWSIDLAMGLCGMAIVIKQTSVFESAFLGLWCSCGLWRRGLRGRAIAFPVMRWMMLSLAPMVLVGAWYAHIGHWAEWWHAMFTSSLVKQMRSPDEVAFRAYGLAFRAAPIVTLALWGLFAIRQQRRLCIFLEGWLLAALAALFSLFQFYAHYALPMLVPLSLAAGFAFAKRGAGRIGFAALVVIYALWYNPFDFAWHRQARADMEQLARLSSAHKSGRGLLVFDGPPWLYAMTNSPFLSPLVFPHHLNHQIEHNVSHLDTDREIDHILNQRPGVIVMSVWPRNAPINWYATNHVRAYIGAHCHNNGVVNLHEDTTPVAIAVFGDCR